MDKVWKLLNYEEEELINQVRRYYDISKWEAITRIENGYIRPSSTKANFKFYISGSREPFLILQSEDLMTLTNGFIATFINDYSRIKTIHSSKGYSMKKVRMMTAISMKNIWGKPKMLNDAINEIKAYLINAKVDYIEAPRIADMTASRYHELLKEFDFRFGRGIFGDWGTIRLLLKWAERIDFEEYVKIRNSFKLEDWEHMITFETALAKKRPEYEPVGLLDKDKHFAHIFQYDILKDVIEECDDRTADRLVQSSAWITKNIFRYLHKAEWLGVTNIWVLAKNDCWISSRRIAKPEKFRQEYNIPKKSFYRQRKKFMEFIECRLPGQPQKSGSLSLDPPTFLDIF